MTHNTHKEKCTCINVYIAGFSQLNISLQSARLLRDRLLPIHRDLPSYIPFHYCYLLKHSFDYSCTLCYLSHIIRSFYYLASFVQHSLWSPFIRLGMWLILLELKVEHSKYKNLKKKKKLLQNLKLPECQINTQNKRLLENFRFSDQPVSIYNAHISNPKTSQIWNSFGPEHFG